MLVLEAVALLAMVAMVARTPGGAARPVASRWERAATALLLLSPLLIGLLHLTPLPQALWLAAPGHALYAQTLRDVGVTAPTWLPLSLVPQATWTSLLAGLPLVAAFLLGRCSTLAQMRRLAWAVIALALMQVLLALAQVAGGQGSPAYFGSSATRPIGSFANSNHLANYLACALALHIWLAVDTLLLAPRRRPDHGNSYWSSRHALALWIAGGMLLVLGLLLTRSRGAVLSGLPAAALALVAAWMLAGAGDASRWRLALAVLAGVLAGAVALVGVDMVLARFEVAELGSSASFRQLLARSTLEGAATFWPWGAGWGSYEAVYPRFQPPAVATHSTHAHQDYAQLLFEGGLLAALLAALFAALVLAQAIRLARRAWREGELDRQALPSALCGLGLLGFLLHSLVEFN
ncbi:MAG TPA: O-antigen ligase family protein, partial [Ramlibacter sp.]|nr:O-antigen ligase family protein [Ramlibacter sp.]